MEHVGCRDNCDILLPSDKLNFFAFGGTNSKEQQILCINNVVKSSLGSVGMGPDLAVIAVAKLHMSVKVDNSNLLAVVVSAECLLQRNCNRVVSSQEQIEVAILHHSHGLIFNSGEAFPPGTAHIYITEVVYNLTVIQHMPVICRVRHEVFRKFSDFGRALGCARFLGLSSIKRNAHNTYLGFFRSVRTNAYPFVHCVASFSYFDI